MFVFGIYLFVNHRNTYIISSISSNVFSIKFGSEWVNSTGTNIYLNIYYYNRPKEINMM